MKRTRKHNACSVVYRTMKEIPQGQITVPVKERSKRIQVQLMVIAGLTYLVLILLSSITFIQLSSTSMANDMFWMNFNTSGTQAFLGNWFNKMLLLSSDHLDLRIDSAKYASLDVFDIN